MIRSLYLFVEVHFSNGRFDGVVPHDNHYKFLKYYCCVRSFIFHKSFCTVVIGQCNRTVGCNRTSVIAASWSSDFVNHSYDYRPNE